MKSRYFWTKKEEDVVKKYGAKLVILNRGPTELDVIADEVINKEIGETLENLLA